MKRILLAAAAACLAACTTASPPASAQPAFRAEGKSLRQIYEYLHANPELSLQERNTSAILAAEMKRLGFTVTTGVGDAWTKARAMSEYGKVEDGVGGYGFVAVMQNGPGPVLMIRADMDALPPRRENRRPLCLQGARHRLVRRGSRRDARLRPRHPHDDMDRNRPRPSPPASPNGRARW